ncbi:MAG TPA: histidine kinase [Caldilineaceae bacterium]|nr:histidine kinase [Caldilineaceae bacterium]
MTHIINRTIENIQQLIQAAPIAMLAVGRDGKIVLSNEKLDEMFGYTEGELVGQPIEILIPQALHHRHEQHRTAFFVNPHSRAMGLGLDLIGQQKEGHSFPVEIGLGYIHFDHEQFVLASVIDLSTPTKQTEAFLEARVRERTLELERRRQVADGLREILALINSNATLDEILEQIVSQAIHLLNADAGAIYQLHPQDGILRMQQSLQLNQELPQRVEVALTADTPIGQSVRNRQPTSTVWTPEVAEERNFGEEGFEAVLSAPLVVKEEIYGSLVLYYRHHHTFSEEALSLMSTYCDQAALAVENARLYAQIERAAVTAERNRIAHDLHDSVTQTLFSASMIADILPRLWQRNQEEAESRLRELRELTRGALAEMRTLLLELRPTALTNVPLPDLIQQLADAIIGRARVPIHVELQGEAELAVGVRVALYRIAQEALNNIAKHAEATNATILLAMAPEQVELLVQDDGKGFLLEQISGQCLGLSIMQERADEIGAKLTIRSQPGQGTIIHVSWRSTLAA